MYEIDRDEEDHLDEWRTIVEQTDGLPVLVAAAVAYDAERLL